MTVAQYLAERGLPVPEDDLVAALDGMLGDRLAHPGSAPLPPAAQAFLAAHAGMVEPGSAGRQPSRRRHCRRHRRPG